MPDFNVALFSSPQAFSGAFSGTMKSLQSNVTRLRESFVNATGKASLDWKGDAADAQRDAVDRRAKALDQIQQAVGNASQVAKVAGEQMAAAVNLLKQFVRTVQSAGFVVMPGGFVTPGPQHYQIAAAAGPGAPGVIAAYQTFAAEITMSIQSHVAALTASDSAFAAQLQAVLAGLATVRDLSPGAPDPASAGFGPTPPPHDRPTFGDLMNFEDPDEWRGTSVEAYITDTPGQLPRPGTRDGRPIPGSLEPAGYEGTDGPHAKGHLLADTLGGPSKEKKNFVTLFHRFEAGDNHINETPMQNIEMRVRQVVEGKVPGVPAQNVRYRVEALGDDRLPHSVRITALGDRGYRETAVIPNW